MDSACPDCCFKRSVRLSQFKNTSLLGLGLHAMFDGCITGMRQTGMRQTDLKNNFKWKTGGSLMADAIVVTCIIQTCNWTMTKESKIEVWMCEMC